MTDGIGARGQWALTTLLVLADGRFPAGGHAHSGGLEPAVADEGVNDVASLEAFLRGRAATTGTVAAAFAAATCAAFVGSTAALDESETCPALVRQLDGELDARIPSPALRAASRRLGRQMLRAGRIVWPRPHLDELAARMPGGLHQSIALGAVAAAADLPTIAAATAAVYESAAGPAMAAVRLLGLDPFAVHAALARLGPELEAIAAEVASHAHAPPADLPACGTPLLDILAERHATWEVRLFAT